GGRRPPDQRTSPAAMSAASRRGTSGRSTGTSFATGRPRSVTVTLAPALTVARYALSRALSSRTPTSLLLLPFTKRLQPGAPSWSQAYLIVTTRLYPNGPPEQDR